MSDPQSLWTIETPTRAYQEMLKTKKENEAVKKTLDSQLKEIVSGRLNSREEEIKLGQKMIENDLESATREAQMNAYKRHEMSKQLRDAWTKQQLMKQNEKEVE